jgi:hypothetical protein
MDFMRAALADPVRRQESFLPLPGAGRKAVVKSAAVRLPKPAGDVVGR